METTAGAPAPPLPLETLMAMALRGRTQLKVLLVSLTRDVSEITALVRSAGHELSDTVVQLRDAPDRRYFVGRGKLEEIAESLEGRDIDIVLFNGELHPAQHYTLVQRLKRQCYHRLRAARKDRGFHLVSLAGYANAGKSSMLNVLTGERVLVEERMFSTLSTTTRAVSGRKRVLLTDTVGFVDQVPFWMVEAFHSTFEEIYESDLVLLLVDASDPEGEILRKVRLAARTLLPRVPADRILPVLPNTDLVPADRLRDVARLLEASEFHARPMPTSTDSRAGIPELVDAIVDRFAFPLEIVVRLPVTPEGAAALSRLYDSSEVLRVDYGPRYTEVRARCRPEDAERLESIGRVVSRESIGPE